MKSSTSKNVFMLFTAGECQELVNDFPACDDFWLQNLNHDPKCDFSVTGQRIRSHSQPEAMHRLCISS